MTKKDIQVSNAVNTFSDVESALAAALAEGEERKLWQITNLFHVTESGVAECWVLASTEHQALQAGLKHFGITATRLTPTELRTRAAALWLAGSETDAPEPQKDRNNRKSQPDNDV